MFADDYARLYYPEMGDDQSIRDYIERNRQSFAHHGFCLWALIEKVTGELIGDCGLSWQNVEGDRRLELGYHIRADRRGNGFASEAARSALNFAFKHCDDFVCSIVAPDNAASIAVATRLHKNKRSYTNRRGEPRLLFYTQRNDWTPRAPTPDSSEN